MGESIQDLIHSPWGDSTRTWAPGENEKEQLFPGTDKEEKKLCKKKTLTKKNFISVYTHVEH